MRPAVILEARVLPAASPIGSVIQVGQPVLGGTELVSQSTRSIATTPEGHFVVTWIRGGTEGGIMAQRFHADGTPDGDEFLVSTSPETGRSSTGQEGPTVAINASGEFVIVWQNLRSDQTSVNRNVYARRYSADGVALGAEFLVHADTDGYRFASEVAIHDDGSFAVVWNLFDLNSNSSQSIVRRFDASGGAIDNETSLASGNFVNWPDLAFLPDGGFLLSFTDDLTLMTARFDSSGSPVGELTTVRDSRFTVSSAIAVDADGDYVLTWSEYDSFNTYHHVYARQFFADGSAVAPAFVVSSRLQHYDTAPGVAMSPEGHFVITWTSGTGENRDVLARAFNAEGVPLGDEFLVTPTAVGEQAYSSVAMTATGEFIINWNDRVDFDVHAQRFQLNTTPTDITLDSSSVAEDAEAGTLVGTLSAIDTDGDQSFIFELVSGEGDGDNAAFQIVGDELRTAAILDYESQSTYSIRVRATDLTGAFVERTLTIAVTNVVEPPTVTLNSNAVDENMPAGAVVGVLGLTDGPEGTVKYRLVGGEGASGNGRFRIVGNQLRTKSAFNFEKQSSYSVRVQATDADGEVTTQVFTIEVTDVNDPVTGVRFLRADLDENAAAGTIAGHFEAIDADAGDNWTYQLVAGLGDRDQSHFTITGNALTTTASLDYEARSTYSVRVRATDLAGTTVERIVIIRITNVNERPTALGLSNTSIRAGRKSGQLVGRVAATDPDRRERLTVTLVGGAADNHLFRLQGTSLKANAVLDASLLTVRIRVTDDDGLWFEQDFTITVA